MKQKPSTHDYYQERINVLAEYINAHLDEDIDLGTLADLSGFSRWHFHRITRAFFGEPIGAYILRVRIETAARLLRFSDMPVSGIAYRVGYDMPSSLSKAFRQFYGISPTQYRKNKNYTIMKPIQINQGLRIESEIRNIDPQQVVYIRLMGHYASLQFGSTWEKLWKFVRENNLLNGPCADHLAIYHDDPKVTDPAKLRTDICLTIDRPAAAKGEVGTKELPGGKFAVFRYTGPYSQLGAVYDTIYGHYIPEAKLRIADAAGYEKYVNSPYDTSQENLITEIYVPVE